MERERLETPSDELKFLRKELLVEKLMKDKKKSSTGTGEVQPENSIGAIQDSEKLGNGSGSGRKTLKLGPSSILSRVKDFLPQMKSANEKLFIQAEADPASVSVEAPLTEGDEYSGEPFVEMNLALMPQDEESAESSEDSDLEDDVDSKVSLSSSLTDKDDSNNGHKNSLDTSSKLIPEMNTDKSKSSPRKKNLITEVDE